MKIYIIDDDIAVVKMLENIIEDNDLGKVCGYSLNGDDSIEEISALLPNIVLIDLLMPGKDGIAVVKELSSLNNNLNFIMISQVSSKNIISKAYTAGIDFFINKPINAIEVKTVINNVSEKIKYKKTMQNIKDIFINDLEHSNKNSHEFSHEDSLNTKLKKVQLILNKLGMTGEKGAADIINICKFLIKNDLSMSDITMLEISSSLNTNPKSMEQRIRRAIAKGLSNIAHLGIEDNMNEIFIMYANSLFNFEEVKSEMDFIRGKTTYSGKINIRKFIDGLIINIDN
ncbi:MAG: vraR [Bacillota bacterium]|nr:vraR [Bacillota bacterium]